MEVYTEFLRVFYMLSNWVLIWHLRFSCGGSSSHYLSFQGISERYQILLEFERFRDWDTDSQLGPLSTWVLIPTWSKKEASVSLLYAYSIQCAFYREYWHRLTVPGGKAWQLGGGIWHGDGHLAIWETEHWTAPRMPSPEWPYHPICPHNPRMMFLYYMLLYYQYIFIL